MTSKQKIIFVAGGRGMLGRDIIIALREKYGDETKIRTLFGDGQQLDFREAQEVREYLEYFKVDEVYIAAANVAGIQYNNTRPATMLYDNLMIQTNLFEAARLSGVKKLMYFGSSCIYPRNIPMPCELDLMKGPLEETNRAYAIAKIAGLEMCASYRKEYDFDARAIMPCNMYGSHNVFGGEKSHVIGDLITRFHEAKKRGESEVSVWGDGTPLREFIYSKDVALAAIHVMEMTEIEYLEATHSLARYLNCGYGKDITIDALAEKIKKIVGYEGEIKYDNTKPNGTHRKLLNSDALRDTGWSPTITLNQGLKMTYEHYKGINAYG